MPELPEVEVTRRSLAGRLAGAKLRELRLGKPLRWPLGIAPEALAGAVLGEAQRRGKYLWLPLQPSTGAAAAGCGGGLLIHLGMSGSLGWHGLDRPPEGPTPAGAARNPLGEPLPGAGPHDHFELRTDRGTLRLTDPRRFGAVVWSPAIDQPPASTLLARLGAEPFDAALTADALHAALRGREGAIKPLLLGGRVVVGAGNIYACEALFRAGIHPRTRARRIGRARCERLLGALRTTLARALELGGSTLRDFQDAHGMAGQFQTEAQVYGRAGQPCRRCGTPIRRAVQQQRATYWCPRCQR
jgi:formamidopyrimidine-DNA glycosylase